MAATMTLNEIMGKYTPNASYKGFANSDDYILAIDTTEDGATESTTPVKNYIVAQFGVKGFERSLNPKEETSTYLRAGDSTTKTGTQVTMGITADRYFGDPFQDFCLSFEMLYGTGQKVIVPYAYFNILTGKGEIGRATVMIENDGSGDAGSKAEVVINLSKVGDKPVPFDWTTDKEKTLKDIESPSVMSLKLGKGDKSYEL
ncbi:phage tail tube protein [[Clostridium] colinum]|uniref:phage tail tube protein n=1 Tax=[Clostridium] colinum TaxID=36835 RepID=UPI002024ACE3|nr:hypothetical protein [[Clostridium] colinum]